MKFYCIADADTVRGFRLAGIEGQAVGPASQAEAALRAAAARPDVGIVILTQGVAAELRERVATFRAEADRPLIVEIPGPGGPLPGVRSLRQLVQAAVGIDVGGGEDGRT